MNAGASLKKVIIVCVLVLAVLFFAELFWIHSSHAETWWQKLKGFHIILGILGGLILMLTAKALGIFWLYRKDEDHD